MRIRFLADNDLVAEFVAAALRMDPSIDFQTARQASLDHRPDPEVLRLAAAARRVLVTSDCMMPKHLTQVIGEGLDSHGVLQVIP